MDIQPNAHFLKKPVTNELQTINKPASMNSQANSLEGRVSRYREILLPEVIRNINNLPNSLYQQSKDPSSTIKFARLEKEITKFSQYLPCQVSNSIFVRVDETKLNSMNILISGSTGTPYAHGLYHFQLYCDDKYPSVPPKMLLLTGKEKVRFNPNLYQNGYICLSLLGTWGGNPSESWNPTTSTLLQIFVSIQSLVMTEDIYFNEPGWSNLKGTVDGNLCNQGYSNVVKLANIRHAMIQMIRNPPIGFEKVVKKHFFLKKEEIIADCQKWLSQKDKSFKNCKQNVRYEELIENNGYGNILEKQIKDLKEVLETLTGQQ